MTVKEIPTNIRCLEYRQNKKDADYGSCLYARFYFNLDKYELFIISDVGNYAHKWTETPDDESFLELMARISEDYLLEKLCGSAKEFDFEATKKHMYERLGTDKYDRKILNRIFKELEHIDGADDSADVFMLKFEEENYDDEPGDEYFYDVWEMVQYSYTIWQKRICSIFVKTIQPKIRKILNGAEI